MKVNDFAWVPSISTIILTFIIILVALVVYNYKLKKYKVGEVTKGYCLLVEMYTSWCRKTAIEMGGKKTQWAAPYFAFLIIYISINNLVAILGIANPISQLTVPLALGSVTFLGLFIVAIKFKNIKFYTKYVNPIEWLTQFSPWISLSFRLFGNIISGMIMVSLLYSVTGLLWGYIPVIGQINILGGFLMPPFHFYFDIFQGILQSYVFSVLTISYWSTISEDTRKVKQTKEMFEENKTQESLNVS